LQDPMLQNWFLSMRSSRLLLLSYLWQFYHFLWRPRLCLRKLWKIGT
jgi:hypothetical protein